MTGRLMDPMTKKPESEEKPAEFPFTYTPAINTDIRKTFARVRAAQEAAKREAAKVVRPIQQKRKP